MIYVKDKDENGQWYIHAYATGADIPENVQRLSKSQHEKLIAGSHRFDENGDVVTYARSVTEYDVKMEASKRIMSILSDYPKTEQDTWPEQVLEATEYMSDPENVVVPILSARATARKITVKQMAEKVLQKRNEYKKAVGKIFAAQDKLLSMPSIPLDYSDDRFWI